MLSPSSIRRFLESLRIEHTDEEEQIINSIITKLKKQNNNNEAASTPKNEEIPSQSSDDEKRRKFEDSLRCKFFGSLLAKIGDKISEKYSSGK